MKLKKRLARGQSAPKIQPARNDEYLDMASDALWQHNGEKWVLHYEHRERQDHDEIDKARDENRY